MGTVTMKSITLSAMDFSAHVLSRVWLGQDGHVLSIQVLPSFSQNLRNLNAAASLDTVGTEVDRQTRHD